MKWPAATAAILASFASPGVGWAQEPWPASAFDEPVVHSTGESADADTVALGDVTGDGRPDAVVATGYSAYELVVFAQHADRSLAEAARHTLRTSADEDLYPTYPVVSLGDLDGDGDLDAATTGARDVVLYHQVDGALRGPTRVGAVSPSEVHLAHLDGDGLADIVTSAGTAAGVSVYRRTSSDATYRGGEIQLADGSRPWPADEVEVGDVNSDGRVDIVGFLQGTVQIYEANADGTYSQRVIRLPYEETPEGIEVADLNGDGGADVAVSVAGRLLMLPQRSGAVSGVEREYESANRSESVEAADVDRDGRLDAISVDDYHTSIGIWRQQSDGTLAGAEAVPLPQGSSDFDPKGLAVGDLDCDGRVDVFVADFSLGLIDLRQAFSGTANCPAPAAPPAQPPSSAPEAAVVALKVRRRQAVTRVRRRGVRVVISATAGCRTTLALRDRRGRLLVRKRLTRSGSYSVRLRPKERLRRGARLRVRATFVCGAAPAKRLSRRVRLV